MRSGSTDGVAVSVLMNCFNGAKYLREAIDSVYAQSVADWEIIFWDNASTDESASIARSYDGRLRYFRSDETLPLFAARKLAMEQCRGEYIGLLDCDDVWLPRSVERRVALFDSPAVGLVHGNAIVLDDMGRRRLKHRRARPQGDAFRALLRNYHLCNSTVMVTRRVLEEHHLTFDPVLHLSGDADLFMRVVQHADVRYLDEVTAIYREHAGASTLGQIQRLPYEAERILQKIGADQPEMFNTYAREIAEWRMRAQLSVLMTQWQLGRNGQLRTTIRGYCSVAGACAALYAASWLPRGGVSWLRQFLGRA